MQLKPTYFFFSKNVIPIVRYEIMLISGFNHSEGLGKYLGALPNHGKVKRKNFKNIVEKMNSRLPGWKAQCLSMEGRVNLTKSVLGAMATYSECNDPFINLQ